MLMNMLNLGEVRHHGTFCVVESCSPVGNFQSYCLLKVPKISRGGSGCTNFYANHSPCLVIIHSAKFIRAHKRYIILLHQQWKTRKLLSTKSGSVYA